MKKKEIIDNFILNYCNKFIFKKDFIERLNLDRSHNYRLALLFLSDSDNFYSDFLEFISNYKNSELKVIVSSSTFNKPLACYYSSGKEISNIFKVYEMLIEKNCNIKLDKEKLNALRINNKKFYQIIINKIVSNFVSISKFSNKIHNFMLNNASDNIIMNIISNDNRYGLNKLSKRKWNHIFDKSTTMKFKMFCMPFLTKKKIKNFLLNEHKGDISYSLRYHLTNKNIFSYEELTEIIKNKSFIKQEDLEQSISYDDIKNDMIDKISKIKNTKDKKYGIEVMQEIIDLPNKVIEYRDKKIYSSGTWGDSLFDWRAIASHCLSFLDHQQACFFVSEIDSFDTQFKTLIKAKIQTTNRWC